MKVRETSHGTRSLRVVFCHREGVRGREERSSVWRESRRERGGELERVDTQVKRRSGRNKTESVAVLDGERTAM